MSAHDIAFGIGLILAGAVALMLCHVVAGHIVIRVVTGRWHWRSK